MDGKTKARKFHSRCIVRAFLIARLLRYGLSLFAAATENERNLLREEIRRLSMRLGTNKYFDYYL